MLRENPQQRPNIYQVVAEVCAMRHRSCPIKDVCAGTLFNDIVLRLPRSTLAAHHPRLEEIRNYRLQTLKSLLLRLSWAYKELRPK
jgi:hypothetical protein